MLRSSKAHLAEVGETYFVHMRFALLVGVLAVGAALACAVHAIAIAENSGLLVGVAVAGISFASALVLAGSY